MKYLDKSFSVSMSNVSQDEWDRIFKGAKSESAPPVEVVPEPTPVPEDYSQRQCAACLEKGQLELVADGLLQCGICQARFPLGIEQAKKVTGDAACPNCDGTGRLRTTFTVFGCGECGGTGARKP